MLFTGPYVNKIDCALHLDGCSFCGVFFFLKIVKLIDACLEDDNQQTWENASRRWLQMINTPRPHG